MQLINASLNDRTTVHTVDQQAQAKHPLPKRPQLIARWEIVDDRLECRWIYSN